MQCHVRLRPQVFNDVRRNAGIIQCESCSRILYYVPTAPAATAETDAAAPPS
jgi:predicted  nucleic acid-binding Zn-ribbon protein